MQLMTDQEILVIVSPMVERMLLGWDENDYAKFTSHFSDKFLQLITKEEFDKQRGTTFPQLGKHTNLKFIHIHRNPDNVVVIWEIAYTGRSMPALALCVFIKVEHGFVMSAVGLCT